MSNSSGHLQPPELSSDFSEDDDEDDDDPSDLLPLSPDSELSDFMQGHSFWKLSAFSPPAVGGGGSEMGPGAFFLASFASGQLGPWHFFLPPKPEDGKELEPDEPLPAEEAPGLPLALLLPEAEAPDLPPGAAELSSLISHRHSRNCFLHFFLHIALQFLWHLRRFL